MSPCFVLLFNCSSVFSRHSSADVANKICQKAPGQVESDGVSCPEAAGAVNVNETSHLLSGIRGQLVHTEPTRCRPGLWLQPSHWLSGVGGGMFGHSHPPPSHRPVSSASVTTRRCFCVKLMPIHFSTVPIISADALKGVSALILSRNPAESARPLAYGGHLAPACQLSVGINTMIKCFDALHSPPPPDPTDS